MGTLLLVHGGLWEEMDADRFWHRPGIVGGLRSRGFDVLAPDRPHRAPTWTAEVDHLAGRLPDAPVAVVAGSNGCSVAVRLALAHPARIAGLLLAWPATAGDPGVDDRTARMLAGLGAAPEIVVGLLAGETLRGTTDADIAAIDVPVAVLPSVPENAQHQRRTVDALLRTVRHGVELPGTPESPRPEFAAHLDSFVDTVAGFADGLLHAQDMMSGDP